MRVVVTGGAGKLGRRVCEVLVKRQHDVLAIDLHYRREVAEICELQLADLLDRNAVYNLMQGCEALVHLGNHPNGYGTPSIIFGENCSMNANVFYAAVDMGIPHVVFASSVQAFHGTRRVRDHELPSPLPYLPVDGHVPANPGNHYGASKVAAEQLMQMLAKQHTDMSWTSLRFPWIVHPNKSRWVHKVKKIDDHPYVQNQYLDEVFSMIAVDHAASLCADVIEKQKPGYHQFFPASSSFMLETPLQEIVETYFSNVELRRPIDDMVNLTDTSEITAKVGWVAEPISFDEEA